jgi:hypothetical protein
VGRPAALTRLARTGKFPTRRMVRRARPRTGSKEIVSSPASYARTSLESRGRRLFYLCSVAAQNGPPVPYVKDASDSCVRVSVLEAASSEGAASSASSPPLTSGVRVTVFPSTEQGARGVHVQFLQELTAVHRSRRSMKVNRRVKTVQRDSHGSAERRHPRAAALPRRDVEDRQKWGGELAWGLEAQKVA